MALVKRRREGAAQPELAEGVTSTKLWKGDQEKFSRLCATHKKSPAEMLRLLVNEALTRRELHAQEAGAGEGVSRRLLQDVLSEQLRPLSGEVERLNLYLKEVAAMIADLPVAPAPPPAVSEHAVVANLLGQLNAQLDEFDRIVRFGIELSSIIKRQNERAESLSQAAYVLGGHTFTWAWTILDLLTRYVAVPQIIAAEPESDAAQAQKIVAAEINLLRDRAFTKRRRLERRLNLPKDEKINYLSVPTDQAATVGKRREAEPPNDLQPALAEAPTAE
jgi:hypothetical protein